MNDKNDKAAPEAPQDENQIISERRAKLAELRSRGQAFPNDFRRGDLAGDTRASAARRTRRSSRRRSASRWRDA
jgi:lysyl-tRNA synthetase, class II